MHYGWSMILRQLFDPESSTYTYLVADPATRKAALIDSVREHVERDLTLLRQLDLTLVAILETHVHADHVTAAGLLRDRTGARSYASAAGAPCVDQALADGDVVAVGALALHARATPGHTDDGMCFVLEQDGRASAVFTGDTLLVRGCGRTDFQNGGAGALWDSITGVLFALPEATTVYPGHDYKGHTVTSIGEERRWNPRLAGKSRDEFIQLMSQLQLAPPKKLAESVPANRACGQAATLTPGAVS